MPEAFAVAEIVPEIADIGLAADVGLEAADIGALGVDASLGAEGLGAAAEGAAAVTDLGAVADLGAISDVSGLGAASDFGAALGSPDFVTGTGFGEVAPTGGDIGLGDLSAATPSPPTGLAAEVSPPTTLTQGLGAPDTTLQASQFTTQPGATFDPQTGAFTPSPQTPAPAPGTTTPFENLDPANFPVSQDNLQPTSLGDTQAQIADTLSQGFPTQQFGSEAFPPASEFSTVQPGSIDLNAAGPAPGAQNIPTQATANFSGPGPAATANLPNAMPASEPSMFDKLYSPLTAEDAASAPKLTDIGSANVFPGTDQQFLNPSGPGSDAAFKQAALDESLSMGPSPDMTQGYTLSGTGAAPVSFGDLMSTPDFANLNTGTTFSDLGYGSGNLINSPTMGSGMVNGPFPEDTIIDSEVPTGMLSADQIPTGGTSLTTGSQLTSGPNLLSEGGPTGAPLDFSGSMDLGGPPASAPLTPGTPETQQAILDSMANQLNSDANTSGLGTVNSVIGQGAPLDTSGVGAGTDIIGGGGTAPTIASTANQSLLSKPIGGIGTLGQIGQLGALLGTGIMALEGPGKLPGASQQAAQVAAFNVQQGEQLLNNAFNGILTPSQTAQIQQQYEQQKSALVTQFYQQGRDPNTDSGFFLALQQIQQELLAQVQTFINADYQQGNAELGLATNADLAVGQQQIALEQAYQTALANALGSAARLTGSGTININAPSGSTVTT